jgi:hypothetical protein
MQKPFRRFELLLPTKFNSGEAIPAECFAETLLDLEERFGAVSSETQLIEGRWRIDRFVFESRKWGIAKGPNFCSR